MIRINEDGKYIAPQVDVIETICDQVLCVSSLDSVILEELEEETWNW